MVTRQYREKFECDLESELDLNWGEGVIVFCKENGGKWWKVEAGVWVEKSTENPTNPGGSTAWADITGKPATFDPSVHTHSEYEPINANIQAHISSPHAIADAQKNSDITKAEIEAKLTGEISSHSHAPSGGAITGEIKMWPTISTPSGFLLCDGAAVSRTTYSDLFALIGTTFGVGDGSTTFNLPNFKGSIPVGLDVAQSEFDSISKTGGSKTHTLTSDEIPSHTHTVNDPGHTHLTQRYPTTTGGSSGFTIDTSMSGTLADNTLPTKSNTTGITVNSTGNGSAHNNLQPYLTINFIIKT